MFGWARFCRARASRWKRLKTAGSSARSSCTPFLAKGTLRFRAHTRHPVPMPPDATKASTWYCSSKVSPIRLVIGNHPRRRCFASEIGWRGARRPRMHLYGGQRSSWSPSWLPVRARVVSEADDPRAGQPRAVELVVSIAIRGENDPLPIRGEAWRQVIAAVGQLLHIARRQVQQGEVTIPPWPGVEREQLPVG